MKEAILAGDFRKPITFENVAQAQEYVERELALLGREYIREGDLRWIIAVERGDIRHRNYLLWLNPDLKSFLVHHSNVETGPNRTPGFWRNVALFAVSSLAYSSLSKTLSDIIRLYPPNIEGYE